MSAWIPEELRKILSETPELAQAFLVGGCVRDWLLGVTNQDFDIEVFGGVSNDQLAGALARWGRTDQVGRSFGVVKLTTHGGSTLPTITTSPLGPRDSRCRSTRPSHRAKRRRGAISPLTR